MADNALFIDYQYCSGCRSCEVACRNEHGYPLDQWGIKVLEIAPFVADEETDTFVWNYYPMVTSLCDLCEDRVAKGGIPSCMLHCLTSCVDYGPIEEMAKKMKEKCQTYIVTP